MKVHISNKFDQERRKISAGFRFVLAFIRFIGGAQRKKWFSTIILLLFVLVTSGFYEYAAYQVGLVASQFYGALTAKSYHRFMWTVRLSIVYIFGISIIKAVTSFVSGHLALNFRRNITGYLQKRYFTRKNYYTIINLVDMDNPDQRFTQDVDITCNLLSEIIPTLLINPILVVFYTYKCVDKAGWLGPVSAYILFIVFAVLTHLLTAWTSVAVYEQERQEGNFRFLHTQFRCDSESAAFLDLGPTEHCFARSSFERLLHSFRVKVNRKPILLCVTEISSYTGAMLNYLTIGVVLFGGLFGDMTTSEVTVLISQTSFFLLYLINKLTTLIALANSIAQFVGVGNRLITLNSYLEETGEYDSPGLYAGRKFSSIQPVIPTAVRRKDITRQLFAVIMTSAVRSPRLPDDQIAIELEHVSLGLPSNPEHILVHDLSLQITLKESLLITGPSGIGKTALLRMLADLWPALATPNRSAYFYRSARISTMYTPQKPFVPSAFACPGQLFRVLELKDEDQLARSKPDSNNQCRALHLAYLLLSVAEKPRSLPDWKSLVLPCDTSKSYAAENTNDAERDLSAWISQVLWCGYPLEAYMKAMELLCEFRLIQRDHANAVSTCLESYLTLATTIRADKPPSWTSKLGEFIRDTFRFGCQPVLREFGLAAGEWRSSYSPGEMQRLVLAAVCYKRPQLVFLDESTSQLSETDESQAYQSLAQRGITPVTVGHRPSVRAYHSRELQLTPYNHSQSISGTFGEDNIQNWHFVSL